MSGVDRGGQFWEHGYGLFSKSHFKNWHKCGHLGLFDFGILNSSIAWNISCKRMAVRGVQIRYPLDKWQLGAFLA